MEVRNCSSSIWEHSRDESNGRRHAIEHPQESRTIAVNIEIMRAFVRMRELLASNKELARKLRELEHKTVHMTKPSLEF